MQPSGYTHPSFEGRSSRRPPLAYCTTGLIRPGYSVEALHALPRVLSVPMRAVCSLPHGSGQVRKPSDSRLLAHGRARRQVFFFFFLNFVRFYLPALLFRGFWLVLRSGQQSALVLGVLGVLEGSALAGFSSRAARSLRSSRLGVYGSPPGAMLCLLAVAR